MSLLKISPETLAEELRFCVDTLEEAIMHARRDVVVDIKIVDDKLSVIFKALEKLSPEDADSLSSLIAETIGRLDELSIELAAFQERHDADGATRN